MSTRHIGCLTSLYFLHQNPHGGQHHTTGTYPGPWLVRNGNEICASDEHESFIAEVFDGTDHGRGNARLIVAACNGAMIANPSNPIAAAEALPELLDALDNLLDQTLDNDVAFGATLSDREFDAWQHAVRAITKAMAGFQQPMN